MDGDTERLSLPNQHEQPLASRDTRVHQVALQQHVVLHCQWNYHSRELRALRLVDRDRIGQGDLVQLPEVIFHEPFVEAHCDLLLNGINSLDHSDIAIEHDLVADLEPPSEALDAALARSARVQYLL